MCADLRIWHRANFPPTRLVFNAMTLETFEHHLQQLSAAAERALNGDLSGGQELLEWISANGESRDGTELRKLAQAVSQIVRLLQEREALLQNHQEELQSQNEDLSEALKEAKEREQELADLHEVAKAITSSLDHEKLILILEDKTKSLLNADVCSLMVRDEKRHGLKIIGPGQQLIRNMEVPEHQDICELTAMNVATSGVSSFVNNVPNCSECRYRQLICGSGTHHMLSVPMQSRDRLVGAINAFRLNKPPFDSADERKLAIIASAAAVAIENAEAYRREKEVAEKLQMGIRPDAAFNLHGFSIGCDYVPASSEATVGGDFYDVVNLGGGRVGIVMADISGKGIDAAVYTAMARFTLRGLMLAEPDPSAVLRRLNDAVCSFVPDDVFITLFYGVLDSKSCELAYGNAGHEPPIAFVSRHSYCMEYDVTGRALGMMPEESYASRRVHLDPGDLVVLFTDGITEARQSMEFFGKDRLQQSIARGADRSPEELVADIFAEVQTFTGSGLKDDAGLLILKVLAPPCEVDTTSVRR